LPILVHCARIITCASLDYIKHSDLSGYYLKRPLKFRQTSFGVSLDQFVIYHDDLNKRRPEPVILFVGGLDKAHYFKGLENLLKALAEIKKKPPFSRTSLNVVGQGDLADYYQRCARDLGLTESVFFHDKVDNSKLVDFYNYCDCLVLPSINQGEAFGLVILEAMACAKPVITSNLPGVRSVFKNRKQGLLVKPDDINDLAEKLQFILGDKKRAEAMGRAGRELVEKKYTWEKVGKKLDVIYNLVKYT
jgi:glycosyltransferase involved in cell wall biosynthesis